jgi:hypothetical protein
MQVVNYLFSEDGQLMYNYGKVRKNKQEVPIQVGASNAPILFVIGDGGHCADDDPDGLMAWMKALSK